MHGLLNDIGIAVISATMLGVLMLKLRQPVILGYLIAGALIGPQIGFQWVTDAGNIETISEIGLILLLFIIGLEMDLRKLISSGKALIVSGIGQFLLCVILGVLFFPLIGYGLKGANIDALYISLICALSSTAIVVKLLYDKFELDTLPGRITLGILIIQDIWAILVLAFQPNFASPQFSLLVLAILKSLGLLGIGFLLSRFILKYVFEWVAKSPEMVVAISIAWCALVAAVAEHLGLSKEMGALIAGISISSFPYSIHVTAKALPLRDFFLTLFFVSLGMKIIMPEFSMILAALIMVIFVIASRFLTVYPLLALCRVGRRTCFISSINLAQISEFSLVIAALGVDYGHIRGNLMAVFIYAMAFTSVLSSYFIKYNHGMYLIYDRLMRKFGFQMKSAESEEAQKHETHSIVILGFHRGAKSLTDIIAQRVPELLHEVLVVDFNPEMLKDLKKMGIAGVFGDISSVDTLEHAHIQDAKIILSTIPDMLLKETNNLKIVKTCHSLAPDAIIVATADSNEHAEKLKAAGASEVLLPYTMAGEYLAHFLEARIGLGAAKNFL